MTVPKRDLALIWSMALAGLMSALIAVCTSYSVGLHAASQYNNSMKFGQTYLPGAIFGVIISCCLALWGYLRRPWKFVVVTIASTIAYFVSFSVAVSVELYSPFVVPAKRGDVSGQALFVGGLAGAFCVTCALAILVNSGLPWHRRLDKAIYWSTAGAFLGVIGWALGPSLGLALWHIAHSMGLGPPADQYRNHIFSLWAIWQVGMGLVLGFLVNGNRAVGQLARDKSQKQST